jgi:hypothetical protein
MTIDYYQNILYSILKFTKTFKLYVNLHKKYRCLDKTV